MATLHDIGDQGLHYDNDLLMTSISIEDPLCNYLTAFDGTKKEFNDIQPYFDNLYSDNFIHLMDGHPIDKQTYACIIKQLLEKRIVATLEDIYFVDDTHVEYTVHWSNGCTSMVTHVVALVADGKIVKVEPCEETKGVFANMCRDCQSSNRNRLNQFTRFRVWERKAEKYVSAMLMLRMLES